MNVQARTSSMSRFRSFTLVFGGAITIASLISISPCAAAQTITSGDIAGVVTDPSGAAVPNAEITLTGEAKGTVRKVRSNETGAYRASLLSPDVYDLTVKANGFETTASRATVAVGQVTTGDIKLAIGQSTVIVQVTSETPLLQTESAETATSLSEKVVQSMPNPGNDITYSAQLTPGAVMNTTAPSSGGVPSNGNYSVFGLPATSNTLTINGTYENDPFFNTNLAGATNMQLGNNEVSQVDVVANAYGAQYGGLGGAQENEITKSGGNKFHGNAVYWWNGSALNANDYFRKQTKLPKSRDNVNQYAASLGGPIIKDRLFFFVDYEGIRIIIPSSGTVSAPSPSYISGTLANVAANNPSALQTYQNLFTAYTGANGYATANSCVSARCDPNAVTYTFTAPNFTREFDFTARVDGKLTNRDTLFGHFKWDKGVGATYTDPLDPNFSIATTQPSYEGEGSLTHVFSANIVNQLLLSGLYYSGTFVNPNQAAANLIAPYSVIFSKLGGTFTPIGAADQAFPQGRSVIDYQIIDDLSIVHGRHTIKTGFFYRRDDTSDRNSGIGTTPLVLANEAVGGTFQSGFGFDLYSQQHPTTLSSPIALYNLAGYLQDTWKPRDSLSLTAAVRVEHNSNPVCQVNCFSRGAGPFSSLSGDPTTPYSQLLQGSQHQLFPSLQGASVNPRVGFNWMPFGSAKGTVLRGGFGLFSDLFPSILVDSFINQAPQNVGFSLFGPFFAPFLPPIDANPASPNSGEAITKASATAFYSAYNHGASFQSLSQSVAGFSAPSLTTADGKLHYPTYEEFSLGIEQALGSSRHTVISIEYVGNHGYHEPVLNSGANAYGVNNGAPGVSGPINFTGLPSAPVNGSFGPVNVVGSGASSNFNGLVATVSRTTKDLTLMVNYEYSHALDEISNGGILPFSAAYSVIAPENPYNLHQNYGNSDYDVRHNITGVYVYTLPYHRGPRLFTEAWQISGTVFHHTGFPFTVVDSAVQANGYAVGFFAKQNVAVHSCGGSAVFDNSTGAAAHPCAIAVSGNYTDPTAFGQQRRNQVFGPSFTDTDVAIQKGLPLPHLEGGVLNIGVQVFNLFNHPNFANPGNDINSPALLGAITSTVNTPTSILGSGLGGDASPRLIQLRGSITF